MMTARKKERNAENDYSLNLFLATGCQNTIIIRKHGTYLLLSKLELSLQRRKNGFNWWHIIILLGSMNPSKSGFSSKLSCHGSLLLIVNLLYFKILQNIFCRINR